MIDEIKKLAMEKGTSLMQSEAVSKLLASEQVGAVIEKAMTIPFKISNTITAQKEKLVALLDLATQEDIDEIRRSMSRVEDVLKEIKKESAEWVKKTSGK